MDGDTDSQFVQKEFEDAVKKNVKTLLDQRSDAALAAIQNIGSLYTSDRQTTTATIRDRSTSHQLSVQDMETDVSPPGVVPTISHHISLVNGQLGGNKPSKVMANGGQRVLANGKPSFRNMLNDAEDPVDSYM